MTQEIKPNYFVRGMGSVLNLFGSSRPNEIYGPVKSPEQRDADALASDWRKVGGDLESAFSAERELQKHID
ncbi:MAG: hypothetical protein WCK90_04630 [archaeon]